MQKPLVVTLLKYVLLLGFVDINVLRRSGNIPRVHAG